MDHVKIFLQHLAVPVGSFPATFAVALAVAMGMGAVGATPLHAQGYSDSRPLGSFAQQKPAYLAHAGLEQRLGQSLPMSTDFTDETGRTGPLSSWFDGKPVVIELMYYKCVVLCPQVLHGLATGLAQTTLKPGKDYDVMVFSIDPTDTPTASMGEKQQFLQQAGFTTMPDANTSVHFLTGSEASIEAIASATGFHYVRVPGPNGVMDQFAHSSVIMFATPEGKLSKYIAGITFAPRDLRMALLEASQKKISNPVDLLILYCCTYSPTAGKYSVDVARILGLAGIVTIFAILGIIFLMTRKPKGHAA